MHTANQSPASRPKTRTTLACTFFSGVLGLGATLHADEVVLKNDSLQGGDGAAIQLGFVDGETGAATFYPPEYLFPLRINRVQIFWTSVQGGQPDSLQEAIRIWDEGLPNIGVPIFEGLGPVLADGFLNEFDIEFFDVIIEEPSPITVGLVFADAPNGDILKPSLVTDVDGCQPLHNPINAINKGWVDLCSFGASGDLVIRAIIEPLEPVCIADFNQDGALDILDFIAFQAAFLKGDLDADLNGDGILNILDFAVFQVVWQQGCD